MLTNNLIFGDMHEKLNIVSDKSVPLFIIDPQYCLNYKKWDGKRNDFRRITEAWIEKILPKMTDDGSAWIFMAYDHLFANKDKKVEKGLINMLEEVGYVHLDNCVTWGRQKGRGARYKLKSVREEIVHFTKHPKKYVWNDVQVLREVVTPYVKDGRPRGWFVAESGMRVRWTVLGNVWFFSSPQWNGIIDKQRHPAQKPFMLIERLILLSSNKNDLIVDPFMGSGVTAMVSRYYDRNYIGIENDSKIYKDAKRFLDKNYNRIISEYEKTKIKI